MEINGSALSSGSPEVIWIGSQLKLAPAKAPPHLKSKTDVSYYQKCIIGPLTLSVDDFVLVSNGDYLSSGSLHGYDVGRILVFYELREMFDRDPYRAIVQWYSWPQRIPHKAFDNDEVTVNFDLELVEDHRSYDSDISLETICGKGFVIHGQTKNSAEDILAAYCAIQKKHSALPMFVCRYKFIKVKKSYRLVPLEFINTEEVPTEKEKKTRSLRERERRKSCAGGIESVARSGGGLSSSSTTARKSRRATRISMGSANALEFVDINNLHKENKVSPIKIIGGRSVVRLSTSEKKSAAASGKKSDERSHYLMASPLAEQNIKVTPTSRAAAARRNLNLSLDAGDNANTTKESDCLNYSIVDSTHTGGDAEQMGNDIKIKLRISDRQNVELDPLNLETNAENTLLQRQRKRLGVVESNTSSSNDIYRTPSKRLKEPNGGNEMTPKTRRKSILKSATKRIDDGTPRRSIQLSNIVEQRIFQEDEIISTPKRTRKKKLEADADLEYTPKKSVQKTPTRGRSSCGNKQDNTSPPMTPTAKLKLIRSGEIAPSIESRHRLSSCKSHKSELQLARERLHVSVVPKSLPCREKEFENIYAFIEGKIEDQCGGCMYVSGVPGTGKTATVTGVIKALQQQVAEDLLPEFEFLEINGMRLTEPRQAYVQIYKQLTGKTVSWEQAHALLEKRFTTPAPRRITTVLLVDELDILCNRRQDVVYNLLDWPTKSTARLVVVTIANTMDLPERLLMGKVTSRLGLTRLTFQPYTHKQLQEIVTERLGGSVAFKGDAVQLVARKVAAVSGDARRALDICRRATEIAESTIGQNTVNMLHVQQALSEMIASAKVRAIKSCSRLEQLFLQAVAAEVTRTGVEETSFMGVYSQVESIAAFMGTAVPTTGRALRICSKLGAERLLISEHSRNDIFQKILLNVSTDDLHYALRVNNNNEL